VLINACVRRWCGTFRASDAGTTSSISRDVKHDKLIIARMRSYTGADRLSSLPDALTITLRGGRIGY